MSQIYRKQTSIDRVYFYVLCSLNIYSFTGSLIYILNVSYDGHLVWRYIRNLVILSICDSSNCSIYCRKSQSINISQKFRVFEIPFRVEIQLFGITYFKRTTIFSYDRLCGSFKSETESAATVFSNSFVFVVGSVRKLLSNWVQVRLTSFAETEISQFWTQTPGNNLTTKDIYLLNQDINQ